MSLIFTTFSGICLVIEMINNMYDVKTDDVSLDCQDNNLVISSVEKVRLTLNLCPNEKMKRFIKKGTKYLEKDLDMMVVFKQHKHHHKYMKD